MSSMSLSPAGPRSRDTRSLSHRTRAVVALCLHIVPGPGGWSLARPDGAIVFTAAGRSGRRRCLEYARDHGVAALVS